MPHMHVVLRKKEAVGSGSRGDEGKVEQSNARLVVHQN